MAEQQVEIKDTKATLDLAVAETDGEKFAQKNKMKPKKSVSFKNIVDIVTFNENWKIEVQKSKLRSEEEQRERMLAQRNL